jgi:hypothetical protein
MRLIFAAVTCFALAGCANQAEIKWNQAQADEAKCESYGAHVGDAAYVQCRAQLDAARTVADANHQAADQQAMPTVRRDPRIMPY